MHRKIIVFGLLLSSASHGYQVYDDEYANTKLPGNPDDARRMPNMPFTVDTNRESDGISSVSPFTTTASSFPLYSSSNNSVSPFTTTASSFPLYSSSNNYDKFGITLETELQDRKDHNTELARNRRIQGLAEPSAGEAEREGAAYSRLVEIGTSDVPLPSGSFLVDSSKRWNPSTFPIQRYEVYRIEVPGDVRWVDGTIETTADAVDKCYVAAGRCRSYLKSKLRMAQEGAKWLQLVCGIGDYVWQLQKTDQNRDRMMPLMEERFLDTLFQVGRGVTFNASFSGELVCFANDADSLYPNNKGVLNVNVRRLSWPPLRGGTRDMTGVVKWPLRYRWPAEEFLEIPGYLGPL
eukprot:CAMPEP_0171763576 /NCGR_PEP_ID=MMETSP0991-20121206/49408_1 /TAXON_ID=483369 /ORGANISM="non described non described, Strain CCMP2098" /LENGTH=349 /DNA_ID=CAMNT_0012367405 /DNA_START=6 /DNA_END=1055 /DNA_ORIENTATION=-